MPVFRYRQDIVPCLIFVSYFLLDLLVFFTAESVWFVVFWMLLGIFPKACISAWNHHHQHVATFTSALPNALLEIVYGFQTGVTGRAWVLHHVLGHHQNYLDQKKDESAWKDGEGKTMGALRYSLTNTIAAYPRCFAVGKRYRRSFRRFLRLLAINLGLLTFFFYWNWINALFVFFLPMCISLYNTVWHTYYHHAGLDARNQFEASYNIVEKWYNVVTGNLGYHTAHHAKMGVHWSKLPELHDSIKDKIPASVYRYPPAPFKWRIKRGTAPHELDYCDK